MRRGLSAAALLVVMVLVGGVITAGAVKEEIVAFNVETKKYHCLECKWAIKCTKNCVDVPLSRAKSQHGVPCKVCGGTCRRR